VQANTPASSAPARRHTSLRTQLLAGILVPIVGFVAVDTLSLYRSALDAAHTAYDRQLVAAAHSIGDMLRLERGKLELTVPYAVLELHHPGAGTAMSYRVSGLDGELLGGDERLPRIDTPALKPSPYGGLVGVYDTEVQQEPMRMVVLQQPVDGHDRSGLVLIQVAEPMANRRQLAQGILWRTLAMQSVLVACVIAATVFVVNRALAPLQSLRRELDAREGADLSPVAGSGAPPELRPVVDSLNQLMQRLRGLLGQQQRFVADAAHQLRTPLAVLNTQLQSGLTGDVPPQVLMAEMLGTVRRATTLSNHMLSLAKVEQLRQRGDVEPCDLGEAAQQVAVELSPLISEKNLQFELQCSPGSTPMVEAHPWMLGELVSNLLHNAIRHTPADGLLGIDIACSAEHVVLECWDSGPGIADSVREHAFEPFSTASAPAGHATGTGLGLAICHAIVESLQGHIALADHQPGAPNPGLRVQVRLPRPTPR
jgi:two-component system sensor histidine kinase TctE